MNNPYTNTSLFDKYIDTIDMICTKREYWAIECLNDIPIPVITYNKDIMVAEICTTCLIDRYLGNINGVCNDCGYEIYQKIKPLAKIKAGPNVHVSMCGYVAYYKRDINSAITAKVPVCKTCRMKTFIGCLSLSNANKHFCTECLDTIVETQKKLKADYIKTNELIKSL